MTGGTGPAEVVAGITIPDTALVTAATALVREATDDLLFHHSRRVFLFGSLQGRRLGLAVDPELLYVGAMFHDLGLTAAFGTTSRRFEADGAAIARKFLLDNGYSSSDAMLVWTAIALHTTPGVPALMDPEIALVTAGVETDVLGLGYELLEPSVIAEVVAAHPRPDFKRRILQAFTDGNVTRPETTFGNVNADVLAHFMPGFERTDFVEIIENSAWPE